MPRHLPNLLSALRLLAAPFAAWLILAGHDTAAFLTFACAGASDALDGFIARAYGFTSRFGAWLDPAADKLLTALCLAALWQIGAVPWWLLALVLLRDGAIALAWLLARAFALPLRFEPLPVGKATTVVEVVYIFALLMMLAFGLEAPGLALAGAVAVALLVIVSGIFYALLLVRSLTAGRRAA